MTDQNFNVMDNAKSEPVQKSLVGYDLAGEDLCKKARVIDGLFILSITVLPVSLIAIISEILGFRNTLGSSFIFLILLIFAYMIFFMLYSLIVYGIIGRSLGKMAVGIKVVEYGQGKNSSESLFTRWLYNWLNNLPIARLYWILVDPKKRIIHDLPPKLIAIRSYDKKAWIKPLVIALFVISFMLMFVSMFVTGGIGPIEHRYYNY